MIAALASGSKATKTKTFIYLMATVFIVRDAMWPIPLLNSGHYWIVSDAKIRSA